MWWQLKLRITYIKFILNIRAAAIHYKYCCSKYFFLLSTYTVVHSSSKQCSYSYIICSA